MPYRFVRGNFSRITCTSAEATELWGRVRGANPNMGLGRLTELYDVRQFELEEMWNSPDANIVLVEENLRDDHRAARDFQRRGIWFPEAAGAARPRPILRNNLNIDFERVGRAVRGEAPKRKVTKRDELFTASSTVNGIWHLYGEKDVPSLHRKNMMLSLPPAPFPYDHAVGLEIEIEQHRMREEDEEHQKVVNEAWVRQVDGSLRNNGKEYVTHIGIMAADALSYVRVLDEAFALGRKGSKGSNVFSSRCGLHVHIDATGHTLEELYRAFLLYSVLEPLLFHVSGNRTDNIFCVQVQECASSVNEMIYFGHERNWLKFVRSVNNASKYTAMNVLPLQRFGTVEFRHHEGTSSPEAIRKWLTLLCDIMVGVKSKDTAKLEEDILSLNTVSSYGDFIREYLPNSHEQLLCKINYDKEIYPGVAFVKQSFISDPEENYLPQQQQEEDFIMEFDQ